MRTSDPFRGARHQTHQSRHDHHHTTHPPRSSSTCTSKSRSSIRPPNLPSPDSVPGPSPHHDCASQTHGKSHHTCITHRSIKVYICSTPGVDPSPSLSNRRLHRLVRSRPHPYTHNRRINVAHRRPRIIAAGRAAHAEFVDGTSVEVLGPDHLLGVHLLEGVGAAAYSLPLCEFARRHLGQ